MSRRVWLGVLVACLLFVAGTVLAAEAVLAPSSSAAGGPMTVQVVVENPDYEILAVDPSGTTYGRQVSNDQGIWRSADKGLTWTRVLTLPSSQHVRFISALAGGTLLAHVDAGDTILLRSSDHGDTWAQVLTLQPGSPASYTTSTPHSIAEGGGFVWLGTDNESPSSPNPNYIYRSADDGATWSIVSTPSTHRRILGMRYDGGKLYVLFGDSAGDGIWVSSDNGANLQPLCTDAACVTVDAAFDPAGTFLLFGTDDSTQQNKIVKVARSDGAVTPVMNIPYDSFSAFRLDASTYLVGTTHEDGVPIVDPDLHLFASVDGGDSFQDVLQKPIPFPTGRADLRVQFSYPDGDFPIQVDGYGTIVGRLVPTGTPDVPLNSTLPTVTGTAQVGQTLTGTVGTWTGPVPISFGQQWQRCTGSTCNPIPGAAGLTYVPVAADVGQTIRLQVTASNSYGPGLAATSTATAPVSAPPAVPFATGSQSVSKYGVYEIVLTGNGAVANPYDTIASVTFTPPSGAGNAKTVEAFYDGGNTWRARAYAGEAGSWSWTTSSSDAGLDAKSGSFFCLATSPGLRGKLKKHPSNSKFLATDDGQTFVGISDTAFNLFSRTWDNGTTPISDATFQAYVADDVSLNVNLIVADLNGGSYQDPGWGNYWSDPGTYDTPNLAAFQTTDLRLRWLLNNQPGVYVNMTVLAESPNGYGNETTLWANLTPAKRTRFMRNVLARFAAFPEISWSIVNDTFLDGSHPKNVAMVDEVGTYFSAHDAWDHLRAASQERGAAAYYFLNAPWNTYIRLETGAALSADQVATYASSPQPVWNSEDYYEGTSGLSNPQYYYRWLFWTWILSGGTTTYGSSHWDRLTPIKSDGYVGLNSVQYIRPYLASHAIDPSLFTDADGLVSDLDGATGDRRVQMMRNGTSQYVIYHPDSATGGIGSALKSTAARIRVDLTQAAAVFDAEWLRASDGVTLDGGSVAGGATRDLTAPWAGADVVLYLNRATTPGVPVNTGVPTVTGTAQVGQTLTGSVGTWTGASSYSQQWQRCTGATCNPIANATGLTYVPVAADVGATLRLQVTASNSSGRSLPANSAQTAAVIAGGGSVPLNTGLPTVSGTAQVGQTLTGTVGSWSGASGYSQQWQRCAGATCNPIANATNLTYVPAAADVGSTLRLQVTASNTAGPSLPANSAQTAVVVAAGGGTGVTDSFTRADALTLGTGWSTTNWFGASSCLLAISANQAAYPAGKSGGCHQYWSADNLADTVASFTATALPPEGGEIDIGARIQNGGSSQAVLYEGAWLRHTAGPDTFYIVRRSSNGNWATVATINGPDITVGDQLAFKLAGTSLSLHRKPAGSSSWTQILAATDTTISGPGRLGLELYNATGAKADDWTISPDLPGNSNPSVPLNTALPTVSGTAQVGQTLTGTVGTWSGATSFAQQWQRCSGASCNPIANATGLTYQPVAADVGSTLRLQVTASNTAGPSPPATSAATAAVIAASGSVPVNTGVPTVTGTAQVGQTLTGSVGTWTGASSYSQQWQRCTGATCNPIANATGLTYQPVAADVGATLRLQVTASNSSGPSLPANSAQTAAVIAGGGSVPLNTGLPTVSGTAQVGQTLTGTVGSWSGASGYSQQWQRCTGATCNPIANATNLTYVPAAADVGSTLRLQVTASNTAGPSLPANSAQTAVVVAAGGGTGVTDSFTRADALTLGTGWSTTNWFGASSCLLAISANQAAYPAGKSGGCHQYWSADNLADTVASFTATALPPEGGEIDIGARIQNGGSSQAVLYEGAWLRHTAGPDTFYIVRRSSNGNWATVATINGPDITVGDQLAFKLAGTSLSLHRKPAGSSSWTQILAATDTTISGPGRLGLELYNATGAKADDWTISPDLPGNSNPSVPLNTALPTVSGTAQVGQTLTGTVGTWSGATSFAQQWQRCSGASCNPIANATGLTYQPVAADVGSTLRLQVTASNTAGPSPPATSAATAAVIAASGSVPVNTGVPTVTGTAQVGQTLTGSVGTWTGASSYSQQWQRCTGATCNPIANATGLTYVPVAADVGATLRLQVTASNSSGPSLPANSAQTAAVIAAGGSVPLNTGLPTVSGTAQVGQTLTGTVGSWSGASGYSQQWQRCTGATCNPIANATNLTYVPAAADVGSTLRLQVTASNTAGPSLPANSAQTAVVVAAGGGTGVTDSFTRADALTLGTGWSTTNWFGASSCLLAISANQAAYPAGKSGGCHQYWSADNLADTVASFTATALPPEGGEIDIGARIQNGGSSQAVLYEGAWLRHTAGPDTFYIVRRSSNGNWATVATINGPDITVGDQLAFKLAGTSLSLHRKPAGSSSWTQILAATDTTISGPGRLGLELYNATGAKADDWTISPDLP